MKRDPLNCPHCGAAVASALPSYVARELGRLELVATSELRATICCALATAHRDGVRHGLNVAAGTVRAALALAALPDPSIAELRQRSGC